MNKLVPLHRERKGKKYFKELQTKWVLDCVNEEKSKLRPYNSLRDKFVKYFVIGVPKKKRNYNFSSNKHTNKENYATIESETFKDFLKEQKLKVLQTNGEKNKKVLECQDENKKTLSNRSKQQLAEEEKEKEDKQVVPKLEIQNFCEDDPMEKNKSSSKRVSVRDHSIKESSQKSKEVKEDQKNENHENHGKESNRNHHQENQGCKQKDLKEPEEVEVEASSREKGETEKGGKDEVSDRKQTKQFFEEEIIDTARDE